MVSAPSFEAQIDALFFAIEAWLEGSGSTIDFETQEGILTLFLPEGSQILLSRQTSLEEVWLASPKGAFHFQRTDLGWQTRQGQLLLPLLADIIQQQADVTLDISKIVL